MKRIQLISVLLASVVFACDSEMTDGTQIIGEIQNPVQGSYVYLQKLDKAGFENLDSIQPGEDGSFEMKVDVKGTDFYRLNFFGRQTANLILDESDKMIEVLVHGTDPNGKKDVTGSANTDLMLRMDSLALKRNSDFQLLNQEALQARSQGDAATMGDIQDQYYYLVAKHNKNMKALIWESIPSIAALYGMNYIDLELEFEFADSLLQAFDENQITHTLAEDLKTRIEGMRILAIGEPAPDISLPDPDGSTISLSSLKGNYVLIDFWAAWCRPCRIENPNVVRLYHKYKDRNFEIYGVSLDRKREAWLKAIEDDGLPWKHVSDLKYFNSEAARTYRINAIPATYLIDPDGKILAKGLRGATLQAKLKEIFG